MTTTIHNLLRRVFVFLSRSLCACITICLVPVAIVRAETVSELTIHEYVFTSSEGESVNAERGSFWVPENRQNPNSRQIKLEFVRFPSTNPKPAAPIVYLAGGPGGSGVGTARGRRFSLFMALREVADVIAFDQRGTGWSNHISPCVSSVELSPNKPIKFNRYVEDMQKAATECTAKWQKQDVDLAGYTTWESAADLEDLRRILGAEKISLWGISYGSHLALAALKRYSHNIERVTIASLEGPDETIKLPARTDAYFGRLQTAINLDPESQNKYPDLIGLMHNVHKKLAERPATVSFTDSRGTEKGFSFGAYDLQQLVGGIISDPQRILRIPALYATIEGQGAQALPNATLELLYRAMWSRPKIILSGMAEAMDAASGISTEREKLIIDQAKTGVLGYALNFPSHLLQGPLGVPDLGDEFRARTITDVPTLLLSGTLDGRTYLESAKDIAKGFKQGYHVIIENAGHNLYMLSPDISELVVNFFKGEPVTINRLVLPPPIFE